MQVFYIQTLSSIFFLNIKNNEYHTIKNIVEIIIMSSFDNYSKVYLVYANHVGVYRCLLRVHLNAPPEHCRIYILHEKCSPLIRQQFSLELHVCTGMCVCAVCARTSITHQLSELYSFE